MEDGQQGKEQGGEPESIKEPGVVLDPGLAFGLTDERVRSAPPGRRFSSAAASDPDSESSA